MSWIFIALSLSVLYAKLNANNGEVFERIDHPYGWLLFVCMVVSGANVGLFIKSFFD
jgi:hypothetical protein